MTLLKESIGKHIFFDNLMICNNDNWTDYGLRSIILPPPPMSKTSNNNPKVLNKIIDNNEHKCNGRPKPNCPLNGQCLTQFLTYKVTSGTSNNRFDY